MDPDRLLARPIPLHRPAAPVPEAQNAHMLVARYRKARKCAQALLASGADSASARSVGSTLVGRTLTAKAADCNVPSETTWALVVELVHEVRP